MEIESKYHISNFIPDDPSTRRFSGPESITGGDTLVIEGMRGEHYDELSLSIHPGSTTVVIGDYYQARTEIIHDIADAARSGDNKNVSMPRGTTIEYVTPAIIEVDDPTMTLRDYFLQARSIAGYEQAMAELWATGDPSDIDEAGRMQQKFEDAGGWTADNDIEQIIAGLRIRSNDHDTVDLDTPVGEMSSGQVSKAIIGRALYSQAGVIIMDDPSVHLDVHSKDWLAGYVADSKKAMIVSTSDMRFAEDVGTRVVEVLDTGLVLNIGAGVETYSAERKRLIDGWIEEAERLKEDIDKKRVHIRDFLGPAAEKTDNMAQVLRREKTNLARMEEEYEAMPGRKLIDARNKRVKQRTFAAGRRSGDIVETVENLVIMYDNEEGETTTIEVPHLDVRRGDKLAIVGPNGSGKSTLLKAIAGRTDDMMIDGMAKQGASVTMEMYSPYTTLPNANYPLRVLLGESASDPMGILQYWGFDKQDHYDATPEDLVHLDEIARAQFALIMARRPNLLILDEPTSYLTPKYQQRLADAVRSYDGTLLVVSHDPYFLQELDLTGVVNMPGAGRTDF